MRVQVNMWFVDKRTDIDNRNGKVVSIRFVNEGESTVKINDTLSIEAGKDFKIDAVVGAYDNTLYTVDFTGAGARKLIIITQKELC